MGAQSARELGFPEGRVHALEGQMATQAVQHALHDLEGAVDRASWTWGGGWWSGSSSWWAASAPSEPDTAWWAPAPAQAQLPSPQPRDNAWWEPEPPASQPRTILDDALGLLGSAHDVAEEDDGGAPLLPEPSQ